MNPSYRLFQILSFILLVSSSAEAKNFYPLEICLFEGAMATPIYVAQEAGFFLDEELDVQVTPTPNSRYLMAGLADGRFHIVQAGIDNFIAYRFGEGVDPFNSISDLRVVLGGATLNFTLFTTPDILEPSDLLGKSLGVDAKTTGFSFALQEMLHRLDVPYGSYNLISYGPTTKRLDGLKNNLFSGTLLFGSSVIQAKQAGMTVLAKSLPMLGPYQATSIAVQKGWGGQTSPRTGRIHPSLSASTCPGV